MHNCKSKLYRKVRDYTLHIGVLERISFSQKVPQCILSFLTISHNFYYFLSTIFQQKIKITCKYECNNTLPTIYKCNSYENDSTFSNLNS